MAHDNKRIQKCQKIIDDVIGKDNKGYDELKSELTEIAKTLHEHTLLIFKLSQQVKDRGEDIEFLHETIKASNKMARREAVKTNRLIIGDLAFKYEHFLTTYFYPEKYSIDCEFLKYREMRVKEVSSVAYNYMSKVPNSWPDREKIWLEIHGEMNNRMKMIGLSDWKIRRALNQRILTLKTQRLVSAHPSVQKEYEEMTYTNIFGIAKELSEHHGGLALDVNAGGYDDFPLETNPVKFIWEKSFEKLLSQGVQNDERVFQDHENWPPNQNTGDHFIYAILKKHGVK